MDFKIDFLLAGDLLHPDLDFHVGSGGEKQRRFFGCLGERDEDDALVGLLGEDEGGEECGYYCPHQDETGETLLLIESLRDAVDDRFHGGLAIN